MATYFKYAERRADSTINWAEVGQNMTDMLKEETRIREAKKAAIDEETRRLGEELSNAPMGEFTPANEFALEFAGSAQETRLIQDNLLRSGLLRPKDYAIMRQNLNDGTKTMFDLSKAYQAEAARKMERSNATDPAQRNQLLEMWFMEQVEGLGNLSDAKAVINQTNGQVSIGKMIVGKDGVKTISPDDSYTVNELNMRIKQDFNYFDVDKAMRQEEAMLGETKSMILDSASKSGDLNIIYSIVDKKQGKYLTDSEEAALQAAVDNATTENERLVAFQRQQEALAANSYLAAEDDIIEKQMVNQYHTSSILTNDIGGYTFEFGKKAFDKNGKRRQDVILIKKKSSGELELDFTDEQNKEVKDYLKLNLRSKISTSEEARSAGIKPESEYSKAQARKLVTEDSESGNLLSWNEIYRTSNPAVVKSQFESLTKRTGIEFTGFDSLEKDANGQLTGEIQAITPKGVKNTITFPPVNQLEWSEQGKFIHGVDDRRVQQRILKNNNYNLNFTRNNWNADLTEGWKDSETELTSTLVDKPQIVADQWETDIASVSTGGTTANGKTAEDLLNDAGYMIGKKTITPKGKSPKTVTVITSLKNTDKVLARQDGDTMNTEKILSVLKTVDPKTNTGVINSYKERGKKELPKGNKK